MVPAVVLIFNSRLALSSALEITNDICPKVTKMGSIVGHRIDYNGVGVLRRQRHIPSKTWPKYPPFLPPGLDAASENAKIGWQKLHGLQAGSKWPYWRSEVTEVHAELKEVVKKIK